MNAPNINLEQCNRIKIACNKMRECSETIKLNNDTEFNYIKSSTIEDLDAIEAILSHLSSRCNWS